MGYSEQVAASERAAAAVNENKELKRRLEKVENMLRTSFAFLFEQENTPEIALSVHRSGVKKYFEKYPRKSWVAIKDE